MQEQIYVGLDMGSSRCQQAVIGGDGTLLFRYFQLSYFYLAQVCVVTQVSMLRTERRETSNVRVNPPRARSIPEVGLNALLGVMLLIRRIY